jgi:hypothetical protein
MAKRFCYSPDHRVVLVRSSHEKDFINTATSALENELREYAKSINKDNNDLESVLHDVCEINNSLRIMRDHLYDDNCYVTHDVILTTIRFILTSGHIDHGLLTYAIELLYK